MKTSTIIAIVIGGAAAVAGVVYYYRKPEKKNASVTLTPEQAEITSGMRSLIIEGKPLIQTPLSLPAPEIFTPRELPRPVIIASEPEEPAYVPPTFTYSQPVMTYSEPTYEHIENKLRTLNYERAEMAGLRGLKSLLF